MCLSSFVVRWMAHVMPTVVSSVSEKTPKLQAPRRCCWLLESIDQGSILILQPDRAQAAVHTQTDCRSNPHHRASKYASCRCRMLLIAAIKSDFDGDACAAAAPLTGLVVMLAENGELGVINGCCCCICVSAATSASFSCSWMRRAATSDAR